jgi:hypothetical protein
MPSPAVVASIDVSDPPLIPPPPPDTEKAAINDVANADVDQAAVVVCVPDAIL